MTSSNQFGFFAEDLTIARRTPKLRATEPRGEQNYSWLCMPTGDVAYLAVDNAGLPTLQPDKPDAAGDSIGLAAVQFENQSFLAMLTSGELAPRVNGQPAPPLTLLRVRDQVQVTERNVLHVSILNRPFIGRPRDEEIGTECPFCRIPFTADTTIYICPFCDKAMHCEGTDKPEEDRLECARLTTECRHCNQPVNMKEGYVYVPNI